MENATYHLNGSGRKRAAEYYGVWFPNISPLCSYIFPHESLTLTILSIPFPSNLRPCKVRCSLMCASCSASLSKVVFWFSRSEEVELSTDQALVELHGIKKNVAAIFLAAICHNHHVDILDILP